MMHPSPRARPVLLLSLLALLWVTPSRAAAGGAGHERWYVVMLGGQRVGHMHRAQTTAGDRITTAESMKLAIRRGDVAVEVEQRMTFTETQDGRPIDAAVSIRMAQMPMDVAFTFRDDTIDIVRSTGSGGSQSTEPLPEGDWLTPAAAHRAQVERMRRGDGQVTLSVLDISSGSAGVAEVTMTRAGSANVQVLGKTVPAEAWDLTMAAAPGVVMREYLDGDGQMLRTTMSLGLFDLELLAADEALALSPHDPPELVASTLVKPEGALNEPRRLRRAVYRLTLPEQFGADLARSGHQRVTWADDRTAVVVVDLDEPVNPAGDEAGEADLAATTMLDHADEAVRRLVDEALGDDAADLTAAQKAERLRQFVHRFVESKNLSVGFATASEVARTGEGDCTEHGVLLAALLRAAGIPSRTVTGLIYVEEFVGEREVFGYHLWTQAWLTPDGADDGGAGPAGARWVDLDATLDDPFDAAHIALLTSRMDEGALFNDLIELAPLLSRLRIEVLETR